MARHVAIPIRPGSFTDVNSLLASAVCHLTALLAMAFVVAAGNSSSPGVKLAVGLADGSDLPASDDPLLQDSVPVETVGDDVAALGPVHLFDDSTLAASDLGPLDSLSELAANESGVEGNSLADFVDGGGMAGQTGKEATEFFGIGGYGQTFVYVVDCSGSMSENGKFERAVYELLQSIEQLHSEQRYFIIFYSSGAYPMDAAGPVAATRAELERTRRWVELARPDGGTYPLPALLAALSMKPDAVYFLSDGLFDPRTARMVRANNRGRARRIAIHAIAFANRESEALMRAIARDSGGKYRFVQ